MSVGWAGGELELPSPILTAYVQEDNSGVSMLVGSHGVPLDGMGGEVVAGSSTTQTATLQYSSAAVKVVPWRQLPMLQTLTIILYSHVYDTLYS